jgi:hypothetical protein
MLGKILIANNERYITMKKVETQCLVKGQFVKMPKTKNAVGIVDNDGCIVVITGRNAGKVICIENINANYITVINVTISQC